MSAGVVAASRLTLDGPGSVRRVADVSVRAEAGGVLAIVGPNGAGKTTLLRMLSGRVVPSGGSVTLDGVAVGSLAPADRARRIAVVTQDELADRRLTTAEYVGLGRIPHHGPGSGAADRRIVTDAIERMGLGLVSGRPIGSLSGGERQRARVARALAQSPRVLLLDEPTNHLDPRGRADLMGLLRGLGITIVAVLHDLALATRFADAVAVLCGGRLVAFGPPEGALTAGVVDAVFGLDCFTVTHPRSGRPLRVFDAPERDGVGA